jgi:DNA-binding transcriptional LysR family regulator
MEIGWSHLYNKRHESALASEGCAPIAEPSLSDLKAFVSVAQHLSFQRAADALGVSRSSLSHAVRSLEQRLGVRLLHRTTRSVALTDAGGRLIQRLVPTLRDLDNMLEDVSYGGAVLTGALRINSNKGGTAWLLRHVIPAYAVRYPRVEVDLVTNGRLVDIVAEGFDAGVRLSEFVPQDMIQVPFGGNIRFLAVAAPAYLEAFGVPTTPDDLHGHQCIRQRLPSGKRYKWEFRRDTEEVAVDVPGILTLDDNDLMVEAAIDGLGVAFVPEPFGERALSDGRLKPLLEEWSPFDPGMCLYYAGHRHVPAPLKAFIEIVREATRVVQAAEIRPLNKKVVEFNPHSGLDE